MLIKEINDIILKHIPKSDTCKEFSNEPYGVYNIDLNSKTQIKNILFCVTATQEVIEYAKKNNYDVIWQHHPVLNNSFPTIITHTAADACLNGINDMYKNHFNITNAKHLNGNMGWWGNIKPLNITELINKTIKLTGSIKEYHTVPNIKIIKTLAVCSGLGGLIFDITDKTKSDAFITGELFNDQINQKNNFKIIIIISHTPSERILIRLIKNLLKNNNIKIDMCPIELDYFGSEEKIEKI